MMMRIILFTIVITSIFTSQVFGSFASRVTVHQLNKVDENILHEIDTRLPTSYAHTHDASFRLSGRRNWTLDLHLNKELVPATFTKYILTKDGMNKIETVNKDFHHCNYQGTIRGVSSSQVVVNTCYGLNGYILVDKELYKIKPIQNGLNGAHLLSKSSSSSTSGVNKTCGTDDDVTDDFDWEEEMLHRARRDAMEEEEDVVVKPKQKIIEALFVADKNLCDLFEDRSQVEDHVKMMVNLIDGYFSELGVRVVLSYLEIWEAQNPMQLSKSPSYTLSKFKKHHGSNLSPGWKESDLAILLYGENFYSNTVGQAYVGNVCHGSPVGIVQDLNDGDDVETAFVTTHEIGHILGLNHNKYFCRCGRGRDCVMDTPYMSPITTVEWSPCSITAMEGLKNSDSFTCLENIPDSATLISDPVCGNEIVDPDEECDCGTPEICESSCCNPSTCTFYDGAVCDKGKCCHNCQLKPVKALCEPLRDDECDLPDYCDGVSETCPTSLYKRDGASCGDGDGVCKNGACISHDLQCESVFGPGATAADFCYDNGKYTLYQTKSCLAHQKTSTCRIEQHKCRQLRCTTWSWNYATSQFSQYHVRSISYHPHGTCFRIDTYQSTLDYAANGLKCGPNKICKDQVCVHDPLAVCEEKCNGNGVCNNMGDCACNDGWQPPFCDTQGNGEGNGGSTDSHDISVTRSTSLCGNHAIDGEEECDCGSPEECQDKCCNPWTCRLRVKGTICREATESCDLSEVCDGESPNCPLDVAKIDGSTCDNEGSCYQGDCIQSRDQQCQKLTQNPDAVNDPTEDQLCYRYNSYKSSSVRSMANCGRDNNGNLKRCATKDEQCGKIMCSVANTDYNVMRETTVNTDQTVQYQVYSARARGTYCVLVINKRSASELGDSIGLVKDGTTCGQNKICVDQQCQDLSEDPEQCAASRCNGHGVCNNGGGCRCEEGFQTPHCTPNVANDIL